jgi:eukaryotic-like serine/threonine-protein kinase
VLEGTEHRRPAPDAGSSTATLPGIEDDGERPSFEVTVAGQEPAFHVPTHALEPGNVVGRHVVLHRLGAGGMGVVYAAYDPELDRKVALKLLLPGMAGPVGRTRLLREAQALGRLSHPNVVAIHDVGTVGEQVWLAMEFVQGQTLCDWLGTRRRWQDLLAVFRSAGEGLAAAHAAGLLHRDFKPANVMVGDDGRVRVMDFGLARVRPEAASLHLEEFGALPAFDTSMEVTRAGTVMGTPAYMAPEQFGSEELTAAADQFAFCVTLWEALYGERPFSGTTWMEISDSVLAGRLRTPPNRRAAPSWLRRACERGLSVDPQDRWPSMSALLETLATGRTRARARRRLVTVGVLAVLGAGVEGSRRYDLAQREAACEASGAEIETAWSPARELELRDALVATGVSHAATTADKAIPWIEQQAAAWREARVEACLDGDVRGRWDADTLDRSLWCLDERRMALESLVGELTLADADVLHKAVTAAAGLASVAPCRDERALEVLAPPPELDREAIRAVRAAVARAASLEHAGRYDEGLALAREALARAEGLQWRPLVAAARVTMGSILDKSGAFAEAETALADAYFDAAEGLAPEVAFEAASALVLVVGNRSARPAEGRHWGRLAELSLVSLGEGEGLRRAALLHNLALIDDVTGAREQARERAERALSIREQVLGPNHLQVAASLKNLANVLLNAGAHDRAEQLCERSVAIYEQALGPEHPSVAFALLELARIHTSNGAYDRALPLLERAMSIAERALGPEHPHVAAILNNLARTLNALGDHEQAERLQLRALASFERTQGLEHPNVAACLSDLAAVHMATGAHDRALPLYERALSIYERAFGPDHADVARSLAYVASVHRALGDYGRAVSLYERALFIFESALGPDNPDVSLCLGHLGLAHMGAGAHDRALPLFERSLAILEKTLGPEHPLVSSPLVALAQLALAQGRASAAVPLAERAVSLAEKGRAADQLAEARFVLARALWGAPADGGRDPARAVSLAQRARDTYREGGAALAKPLAEVEAWLREVGEP